MTSRIRLWSVLAGIGVAAVLAAGWFLLISPQRNHASDLRAQAAAQDSSDAQLRSQIAMLQSEAKQLVAKQAQLDVVRQQLPTDPQLPSLIRSLTTAAHNAGVDFVSLTPSPPVAGGGTTAAAAGAASAGTAVAAPFQVIPLAITVQGNYAEITRYLQQLERLPRSMLVTGLTVTRAGATAAPTSGSATAGALPPDTLSVNVTARVFMAGAAATTTGSTGSSSVTLPSAPKYVNH